MIENKAEESHSGYCTCLENRNPSRGSWVRVPPPPPTQFFIGVNPLARVRDATRVVGLTENTGKILPVFFILLRKTSI